VDQSEALWQGTIKSRPHAERIVNVVAAIFVIPGIPVLLWAGAAHHVGASFNPENLVFGALMIALPAALSKYKTERVAGIFVAYSLFLFLATVVIAASMLAAGAGLFTLAMLPLLVISCMCFLVARRAARATRYLRGLNAAQTAAAPFS
jgi:predicted ferric reductase